MSLPELSEAERLSALVDELTLARRRGLDGLDLDSGQYKPVPLPHLETLARRYADDAVSARTALIRDLLLAALAEWQQRRYQDEAQFVRRLFFTAEGGSPGHGSSPKVLRDAAKDEWHLDDDAFDERRRAFFRLFARFLIEFVELPAAAAPATGEQEQSAVVGETDSQSADRRRRTIARRWLIGAAALLILGVLAVLIVWLGTRSSDNEPTAVFRFDDLGGGSSIIYVYPGVTAKAEDKRPNGTFGNKQTAVAVCKTKGRLVHSDTVAGERDKQSDDWVRLQSLPGKTYYATLVYGDIDPDALASLPMCR